MFEMESEAAIGPEETTGIPSWFQDMHKFCWKCGTSDKKDSLVVVCGCQENNQLYMHLQCFREWFSKDKHWWRLKCKLCKETFHKDVVEVILEVYKEKLAMCNHIFPWPDESDPNYRRDYTEHSFNKKQQAIFLRQMAGLLGNVGDRERQTEFLKEALDIKLDALGRNHHEVRSLELYLKTVDQWDEDSKDMYDVDKEVTILWRCVQDYRRNSSNLEMIKILLEGGADPNHECCPLLAAKEYNAGPEVVELLLKFNADVNIREGNRLTRSNSLELITYSNWEEWDASRQEHRKTTFIDGICPTDQWCCMNDEGGCVNIPRLIRHWKLKDNGLRITRFVIAVQTVIDHVSDATLASAWFIQGRYLWFGWWLGCNFLSTILPGCLLLYYRQPLWIAFPMCFGGGMLPLIYQVHTSIDDGRSSRMYRMRASEIDVFGWKAEVGIRNNDRLRKKYTIQKKRLQSLYEKVNRFQQEIGNLRNARLCVESKDIAVEDRQSEENEILDGHDAQGSSERGIVHKSDEIHRNGLNQKSDGSQESSGWCPCFWHKNPTSTLVVEEKVERDVGTIKHRSVEDLEKKLKLAEEDIEFLTDKIHCTADSYKEYLQRWIRPYDNYSKKFEEIAANPKLNDILVSFKREIDCLSRLDDSHRDLDMFKDHKKLAENLELLEQRCKECLFRLNIAHLDRSIRDTDKASLVKQLKAAFLSACSNNPQFDKIEADIEAKISNEDISWTSKAFADPHILVEYKDLRKALSEPDILLATFEYNKECLDNMKWIKSQLTDLDRNLASIIFELNSPDIYKLWEVTTESLPQLFLQIYVLLVGELSSSKTAGISGDIILYVSLSLSFISNVLGTTRMFEPRGCGMLFTTILYGVLDTFWRGFSLCIPLSNSEYSYFVLALILVFTFINGLLLGNFFIRRTELELSHGSIMMWFGSFFLGASLFLCATPVLFLISSSGVDPSVSFVKWAFYEAIARLLSGLILLTFSDWQQWYVQIIMTIICGLFPVALLWIFPNLIDSIPRNNILLDPFGNYQKRKSEEYGHSYVIRQKIEVYSVTADQWLPGFVSGYGVGEKGKDLSKIQVIYRWDVTDSEVRYFQKEIRKNYSDQLRERKLDHYNSDPSAKVRSNELGAETTKETVELQRIELNASIKDENSRAGRTILPTEI